MLLLLPYTAIVRLYSLIHPALYPEAAQGIFSKWILGALSNSPLISVILAIIILYIQGVLINLWANQNNILTTPSSLPGMVFILLASFLPSFQILSPELLGMTFIILGFSELSRLYKKNDVAAVNFNVGLFTGLAYLFSPQLLFSALFVLIGMQILRSFDLKERLQFFIGLVAVLFIVVSFVFFFTGNLPPLFSSFGWIDDVKIFKVLGLRTQIVLGFMLLLMVIGVFNYYSFMKKKQIDARKKIDLLYWFLLSGLIGLFFYNVTRPNYLLFALVPLSIMLGMLMNKRNTAAAELFHIGLLMLLLFSLYGEHFGITL